MRKSCFSVDKSRVRNARMNAYAYFLWPVGLVVFIVLTSDGFFPDPRTSSLLSPEYVLVALASLAMMLVGVYSLRQIPKGAENGRIRLDEAGIDYSVGSEAAGMSWRDIAAIHVHRSDFDGGARALWLARTAGDPPKAARMRRMLGNRLARPVETPDGLLVPLLLFSADDGRAILAASRDFLAASAPPASPK